MMYSVKEVMNIANISRKTLYHYERLGLLIPIKRGDNGYRYYDDTSLLRLQQIQIYQQLNLSLTEIAKIVDEISDPLKVLYEQQKLLLKQKENLEDVLAAIAITIKDLKGEEMEDKRKMFLFEIFRDLRTKIMKNDIDDLYFDFPTICINEQVIYKYNSNICNFSDDGIIYTRKKKVLWQESIENITSAKYGIVRIVGAYGYFSYSLKIVLTTKNEKERVVSSPVLRIIEPLNQFFNLKAITILDKHNLESFCQEEQAVIYKKLDKLFY